MHAPGPLERVLMPLHEGLDALFFAHQVALLDRDGARAQRCFLAFRDAIETHAVDEESHVLPLYARSGGDATDSPSAQFRLEHDKIRRFLTELAPRIAALAGATSIDDRELLGILDRESWFKNLFTHHDLRERNVLYPWLSLHCDATSQEQALARLRLRAITPCG